MAFNQNSAVHKRKNMSWWGEERSCPVQELPSSVEPSAFRNIMQITLSGSSFLQLQNVQTHNFLKQILVI